ncbi:MAG: Peptidase U61, LD-carboxypeptidase A [Candidatus Shapirobacteria bacterium GW2011_GWE1_38_10]|uniref:Peptidase U61, LD-carboxypeptidase A n=1 Tax=Candidatus Shapirobacteria bacterium GW2011_GWE1_38_10 TaxID=1618488 RepID=A0A0G0IDY3_9BACT|nr:MAG: Peptidase U61, LD-carboxypeptidase A [Candidatus Shapirobacteria bacterium GW2011_GWE1_38_10]
MKLKKPRPLSKGDTIGIVAPSFFIEKEANFKRGVKHIEDLGYKIKYGKHVFSRYRNTTATANERVEDIMSMFSDKDVKAVIASDGGCTTIEVLDKLDYDIISNNPKIFSGFSDIGHLDLALLAKSNLTTLYGLDVVNGFGEKTKDNISDYNIQFFKKLTTSTESVGLLPKLKRWESWRDGMAEGYLVGGWIDSISSLANTPYFPYFNDIILFWEAIDLQPHNLNILLNSLKISDLFKNIRGMIVGNFVNCEEKEYWDCTPTIKQIVLEATESTKIPILANVDFGHSDQHLSIPEGILSFMDSNRGIIEIKESYCE